MKYLFRSLMIEWQYFKPDLRKCMSLLTVFALWLAVIFAVYKEDFGAALTFAVIIIAWKLKSD